MQHLLTTLKPGGRAAIVLPDNCLFEDKADEVFEIVMADCNVHTILRLTRCTFVPYANAQANVVFFQKGRTTEKVWIYDCRSNIPACTKKDRPLTPDLFIDFERCYGSDRNGNDPLRLRFLSGVEGSGVEGSGVEGSGVEGSGVEGRFQAFHIEEIKERGYKLDLKWLKDDTLDDPNDLPDPVDLIAE
ncbi:site-specific DNA-methyltransferase (Adenine-specific) [Candidatus Vecturithrix granuli]|uniref:site-specific DNA-methyltransferase (adenine-specific) n=1 Tax=Vecturithrix granuli TaxID=1499967 RepID=A0A081C5N9_VECG1|nr:site-specific DNA-methyltransferase (Adenine-specific) [Candidatus Vecturithrix granuli]